MQRTMTRSERRGFDPRHISWLSLGTFGYLVVVGSLVGFPDYIFLLRHCDPAKVATYAYVNSIVAVLLGALFAHETLTLRTLAAAGPIVGSVALVITAQQSIPKPKAAPPITAKVETMARVR